MKTEQIFEGNRIEAGSIQAMLKENKIESELYEPPQDSVAMAVGYAANADHTQDKPAAQKLLHKYLKKLGEK